MIESGIQQIEVQDRAKWLGSLLLRDDTGGVSDDYSRKTGIWASAVPKRNERRCERAHNLVSDKAEIYLRTVDHAGPGNRREMIVTSNSRDVCVYCFGCPKNLESSLVGRCND